MSQIGPTLPSHLQKKRGNEGSSSDSSSSEDEIGPAMPPAKRSIGPSAGPREARRSDSDSGSDDDVGPRLPEVPCRGLKPPDEKVEESSSDDDYGPALPPHLANKGASNAATNDEQDSESDDDDMIGPMPPKAGDSNALLQSHALDIERRAQSMKDKIEGKDKQVTKRETWMLELPDAKAKNFGLGPRTFSRKGKTEIGDRSGWTETPEDKERRARGEEVEGGNQEEEERERTQYLLNKARDEAMDKVSNELKKKRGTESLLEKHEKQRKKKAKKDKKEPKERKPFDRDADLGVNKFDDAQRKLMIKKAGQIDSRFSSGQQKFL
eukprot:TRINITY_DN9296_c0_g1_i4.p1 TRINITY_DN9296_c0_g1~~TRINITY_DN9296_c0_g1_i4.p1  ORF type:complete len:335 (+),score=121.17 TRINITY_DN9296_c0_g1_i4:36-1007(+)